mmetsp:Transcript_21707/g.24142  ORF Transcript_21707/g.24142 Transcript_21707/m.24142 type:complete len:344 (-) Transcript_21707:45-1076(-)
MLQGLARMGDKLSEGMNAGKAGNKLYSHLDGSRGEKNGSISWLEFQPLCAQIGWPIQSAQAMWYQSDHDRSGTLSRAEFLAFCGRPDVQPHIVRLEQYLPKPAGIMGGQQQPVMVMAQPMMARPMMAQPMMARPMVAQPMGMQQQQMRMQPQMGGQMGMRPGMAMQPQMAQQQMMGQQRMGQQPMGQRPMAQQQQQQMHQQQMGQLGRQMGQMGMAQHPMAQPIPMGQKPGQQPMAQPMGQKPMAQPMGQQPMGQQPMGQQPPGLRVFKYLDGKGSVKNGSLSFQEFHPLCKKIGWTQQQAQQMWYQTDVDRSGTLTQPEFLRFSQRADVAPYIAQLCKILEL